MTGKQSISEWRSKSSVRPWEFCLQKARIKMMFITRFDKQCVIHKAHLPQGRPVNSKTREPIRVIQADSEKESQLVPTALQCLCSFCRKRRALPGELWCLRISEVNSHEGKNKLCYGNTSIPSARLTPMTILQITEFKKNTSLKFTLCIILSHTKTYFGRR